MTSETEEIFERIEGEYHLGIRGSAVRLNGGLTHRMYRVESDMGLLAVKLLNPHIMARPDARGNFKKAEELECRLEKTSLPILPAKVIYGEKMLEADGQFFYIFDYWDGKKLSSNEAAPRHTEKIGEVLAKIHGIDEKKEALWGSKIKIDFDIYLNQLERAEPETYSLLSKNVALLMRFAGKQNEAADKIPRRLTICHRDMDTKNVLWRGDDFRVIDLECLSYSSPYLELFETALAWSGIEEGALDEALLKSFIRGYINGGGLIDCPSEILYDCSVGRLEWLEYSLKRILGIGCGENEREIGITEAQKTINYFVYYSKIKERILSCFEF